MPTNWNRRKYTKEQLIDLVENSFSWREVARKLNMNLNSGGTFYGLKAAALDLQLNTNHFTGKGWNQKDKFGLKSFTLIPLEDILVEKSTYTNTTKLKKRLIDNGYFENKCSAPFCQTLSPFRHPFTGELEELKLSLDHINGDRFDNRITNLRLLCYTCHGYTDTYGSKNISYQKKRLKQ